MTIRSTRARGAAACGLLAATATLALGGVAFASHAIKNASYSGAYTGRPTDTISFKVSANGKRVVDLSVSTPYKCSGGCGGVPNPSAGSVRITGNKFKVTLKLREPGNSSKVFGSDTVTGTFEKGGTAKGTVKSHFDASNSGETVSWTAVS